MKEIVYIQAGRLSNYTGTHFWNTQESYISHQEQLISDDAHADSKISFCESVDAQDRYTLCPRALIFDTQSNFGAIESVQSFSEADEVPSTWNGPLVEHRHVSIPKSQYQILMEQESGDPQSSTVTPRTDAQQDRTDMRYWSDFSRVYYHPRSLQKLANIPDWGNTRFNWVEGQASFSNFNEEYDLIDGAMRLFVEDCDNLQGIQVLNDTDSFGGFMGSFFESFRDEYSKLPSLVFPMMSKGVSRTAGIDSEKDSMKFLNEALYLRTLNEFSSLNVPIRQPSHWPASAWDAPLHWPQSSLYHQSGLLSAHIESATFPLRAKNFDIAGVCGRLKWRSASPFAELKGAFPATVISHLDAKIVNFSSEFPQESSHLYSRIDVTRGFSSTQIAAYTAWPSRNWSPQGPHITSIHCSPYPLPNSFPSFSGEYASAVVGHPSNTEVFSSLSTSSNTALFIEGYALLVEQCVARRPSSVLAMRLTLDDLKELANDLWTIHDNASDLDTDADMS